MSGANSQCCSCQRKKNLLRSRKFSHNTQVFYAITESANTAATSQLLRAQGTIMSTDSLSLADAWIASIRDKMNSKAVVKISSACHEVVIAVYKDTSYSPLGDVLTSGDPNAAALVKSWCDTQALSTRRHTKSFAEWETSDGCPRSIDYLILIWDPTNPPDMIIAPI